MRVLDVTTRLVATLACVHLSACQECRRQNDCPDDQYCNSEGRCEAVPDECDATAAGSLSGHVRTPDGSTRVIGATVTLDDGQSTTTDADGRYSFDAVSDGPHTVTAARGEFVDSESVDICGGAPRALELEVAPPGNLMAVVDGDYDSIEEVLRAIGLSEGLHFDMLPREDLASAEKLAGYEYLFLNCTSSTLAGDPTVQTALRDWVDAGGRLYASDWAYEYVELLWPEQLDFAENPKYGEAGQLAGAIMKDELEEYLGKADIELDYNLGSWVVVEGAAAGVEVLAVSASIDLTGQEGQPLLLQFPYGEGRVTYTTFHNEAQTTGDMDLILSYLSFSL